jgi:hypothetical protein
VCAKFGDNRTAWDREGREWHQRGAFSDGRQEKNSTILIGACERKVEVKRLLVDSPPTFDHKRTVSDMRDNALE